MPLRFTNRILHHLSHANYAPAPARAVARDLRVDAAEREVFDAAVDLLASEGRLEIGSDDNLRLPRMGDEIVGRFRLNARGFGFIIPDTPFRDGHLFVPRGSSRDAVSGDTVRAEVVRQEWRGKTRPGRSDAVGRIVEVLARGQEHFVGTLIHKRDHWYVEPDGRTLHDPVVVRDPHAKGAKAGDKVVIELIHYPDDDYHAEGVIVRVLGEAGRPDVETQAVIAAHGLRQEFPESALDEARQAASGLAPDGASGGEPAEGPPRRRTKKRGQPPFPGPADSGLEREDLTDSFIFTIDPPDAKDFDDAISIVFDTAERRWTLGVHIADVSHFVRGGGALDAEARERGNSVYLPRLVIPMLPEILSNGVCSLQESVPRFAKSAFIDFDETGRVLQQRAASTVIRSRKRLTYLEAQALIDGRIGDARAHSRAEPVYDDELIDTLRLADRLARVLLARRRRDGMIELSLPEVELIFDDEGHVIDAVPEDDAFTHRIIEMFMVEANEAVARLFDTLSVPILRRIHPEPRFADIEELRIYARAARLELPERPTRQDLQRLLSASREQPAGRALHFALLRTLTKATYSPAHIGHYALASEHYAHFTSPIRRYPDLAVHRALAAFLEQTENGRKIPGGRKRDALGKRLLDDDRVPDEASLVTLGRHCSDAEQEAEDAERELREFLVLQFLAEKHLGEEFEGVVTGVTSAGVFVSIERYLVEGLVKLSDLPASKGRPDRWAPDHSTGRLVADRSGRSVGIGDFVKVRIVNIDLASRHLDLMLTEIAEPAHDESPRGAREKGRKGRGGSTKDANRKPAGPKGKEQGYGRGRRGRRKDR